MKVSKEDILFRLKVRVSTRQALNKLRVHKTLNPNLSDDSTTKLLIEAMEEIERLRKENNKNIFLIMLTRLKNLL